MVFHDDYIVTFSENVKHFAPKYIYYSPKDASLSREKHPMGGDSMRGAVWVGDTEIFEGDHLPIPCRNLDAWEEIVKCYPFKEGVHVLLFKNGDHLYFSTGGALFAEKNTINDSRPLMEIFLELGGQKFIDRLVPDGPPIRVFMSHPEFDLLLANKPELFEISPNNEYPVLTEQEGMEELQRTGALIVDTNNGYRYRLETQKFERKVKIISGVSDPVRRFMYLLFALDFEDEYFYSFWDQFAHDCPPYLKERKYTKLWDLYSNLVGALPETKKERFTQFFDEMVGSGESDYGKIDGLLRWVSMTRNQIPYKQQKNVLAIAKAVEEMNPETTLKFIRDMFNDDRNYRFKSPPYELFC